MASTRCIHMDTLHGDALIFQCKNLKGSEITYWRMSFSPDMGCFFNKNDEIITLYENASRALSMVHCTTAVNLTTRQRVPCMVLRLHEKGSQGFKYMLYSLSSRTRARLHVEFSLPYQMHDVSILHGPTLIWSHGDTVFYVSAETGCVKEVPIHLKVHFLGEFPLPKRQLVILGSQKIKEVGNDVEEDKTVLYFIEDGRTFSADCLIPSAYSSVVRCMLVLTAKEVDGSLRSTVVAATCMKQLLWFENGLPEEVCLLPYEDPQSIRTVYAGSGCLIVIEFGFRNVCAVWKDTFKVASFWTDVRFLLVDDFLGVGFEQMLLLFGELDSTEEILGKFLLTDLCGVHYSLGRVETEDGSWSEMAEENITLTVHALQSRLQSGLTYLHELQRDLCVKDHFMQQCVLALRDLLSDRKHILPSPLQEGLVPLLDEQSDEDECALHTRVEPGLDKSLTKVDRVWHRVIGQTLVFGALLAPIIQTMEFEHVIAAVVATPPMAQCVNKIIYPELLTFVPSGPPHAKRSKSPTGPVIVLITDLAPLLTFDSVQCSVVLCFSTHGAGSASRHCELVNLDLKGALEGKFQPCLLEDCSIDSDEARDDLLSLVAVLESWSFGILSTERTVVDLPSMLEEKFGAKRIKVNPQYSLSCCSRPSGVVLFHYRPCGSFHGILDVYCSDHLCLLYFMDTMCNFFPAFHCIQLLKHRQGRNKSPAVFMEHEIRTIKQGMTELIHSEAEIPKSDLVHVTREQWLRERSDQLHPLVDMKHYRQMVERTMNLKMASDVALLVEVTLNVNQ